MARFASIVVDCETPAALARFWAAALDGFGVRPYDEAEVARLAELGYTPETDPVVFIDGPHNLSICFQRIEFDRPDKTSVHLDIATHDRPAEVDRLVALGATTRQQFGGHTWMLDPEGNDFCVVDSRAP